MHQCACAVRHSMCAQPIDHSSIGSRHPSVARERGPLCPPVNGPLQKSIGPPQFTQTYRRRIDRVQPRQYPIQKV